MQTALRKIEYNAAPKPSEKRVVRTQGNVTYINGDAAKRKAAAHGSTVPKKTAAYSEMAKKSKPAAMPQAQAEPKRGIASTLFVLIVAFAALTVLVSRYAAVCSIGTENNTIKQNIEAAEAKIEDLKLDMELRDNLQYVQDTAQEVLGMTYPDSAQKLYVDMSG